MKKYYLFAAAVTMLTACTNSEKMTNDLSYDGPVMIGFETFHEKATKATATDAITGKTNLTKEHGGFGVWGYKGTPTDIKPAEDLYNGTTYPDHTLKVNISDGEKFTPIFENVQVWYVGDNYTTTPTQGFTYTVPKYWDKGSEYTFFAYAPYNGGKTTIKNDLNEDVQVNVVSLDNTTGNITVRDIESIQDVSTHTDNKANDNEDANLAKNLQYKGSNTTGVTDYLMATYVPEQKLVPENTGTPEQGTNQNYGVDDARRYEGQEQTVGFTFGHMLSKFKINLQASALYSGVEYIKVDALSIKKMPTRTNTAKTVFTQTSPTAPAGTYSPNYYSTDLVVIGTNGTSTSSLYILKDGSISNDGTVVTDPTSQVQEFNYYVAPSKADNDATTDATEKYVLNIAYTIHYVDGITETVTMPNNDLSDYLTQFQQNYQYTLNIKIGLNQIYFTVDAVTGWQTPDPAEQRIEIK